MKDKAYKLLALQLNISNGKAKEMIDRGLVSLDGRRVKIARQDFDSKSVFEVEGQSSTQVILQDENLVAVERPYGITSEEVSYKYGFPLIHRLDQDTSGILLLAKSEEFRQKAIEEFEEKRVYKEYTAWVSGHIEEEITIDKPIFTTKGESARSVIDPRGKKAITEVYPLIYDEVKDCTKIKVVIKTGRTHQIRVHLTSIGHPVIGDVKYGGKYATRLMLHAKTIKILSYEITSSLDL